MSLKAFAATLGLASLILTPAAMADQWNKKTYITINESIQVPGKVLQPGKYVMKLADSPSNRHIVQIYNEREDQLADHRSGDSKLPPAANRKDRVPMVGNSGRTA